jgi:hypothetical protein
VHARSFAGTFVLQIGRLAVCRQCPRVTARALADVPVSYPRRVVCSQNGRRTSLRACPARLLADRQRANTEPVGLEDDDAPLGQVMFDRRQVPAEKGRLLLGASLVNSPTLCSVRPSLAISRTCAKRRSIRRSSGRCGCRSPLPASEELLEDRLEEYLAGWEGRGVFGATLFAFAGKTGEFVAASRHQARSARGSSARSAAGRRGPSRCPAPALRVGISES